MNIIFTPGVADVIVISVGPVKIESFGENTTGATYGAVCACPMVAKSKVDTMLIIHFMFHLPPNRAGPFIS